MSENDALPDYWPYPPATRQIDLSEVVNVIGRSITNRQEVLVKQISAGDAGATAD
jgi:hypothetical protein